jgi:Domain of unknown function (DUF4190)
VAVPTGGGTSKWAVASLVCSLVGLCIGLSSILGVIFGHMALSEIKRSNNYVQGRGLALAGLILGYVEIALAVIVVIFIVVAAASTPQ